MNNEEIKHSDLVLERAALEGRGLTRSERQELREAYNWEQEQATRTGDTLARSVKDFKDNTMNPLDLPRHRVASKCQAFLECPIDFKCRNFNSSYIACRGCTLNETDDVCKKPHLHNDRTFNMLIKRDRIDLDGQEK